MLPRPLQIAGLVLLLAVVTLLAAIDPGASQTPVPAGRQEVIFWHFWGGQNRAIIDQLVRRFNESQDRHFVRAIAMPGNNLDLKFFLAVTGGDPPDLLNQDDPIVADWAHRGALTPLDALATPAEMDELPDWLFPPAHDLGSYNGRLYALCNGLDVRLLYYNQTLLDQYGLAPPKTLAELDHIAFTIAPPDATEPPRRYGYLPDPRRLWAWGIVFGGRFYDPQTGRVTADDPQVVRALEWMTSYSRAYGPDRVTAFRKGDQALSGAAFPLLQGRYAVIMDGQWRVAEIAAEQAEARARGEVPHEYGVVPLPPPKGGLEHAGWVNGNFFVVPRGSKNPAGAWEFMKFWSGFGGHEAEAARICAAGGWIPASEAVVREPEFQDYLQRHPLFRSFVELAGSPHQKPTPAIPVASYYYSELIRAAEDAMYRGQSPEVLLSGVTTRVQAALDAVRRAEPAQNDRN